METASTPEKIEFSKFNVFRNFFEGKINDSASYGAAKKQSKRKISNANSLPSDLKYSGNPDQDSDGASESGQ